MKRGFVSLRWTGLAVFAFVTTYLVISTLRKSSVSSAERAQAAPPIVFVDVIPHEIEVGVVFWGTRVPVEFEVANRGSAAATIDAVTATCGCFEWEEPLKQAPLLAGQTRLVRGTFDAGTNPGDRAMKLTVDLADAPDVQIDLRAKVVGDWLVFPDRIDFGLVAPIAGNTPATAVLYVYLGVSELSEVRLFGCDALSVLSTLEFPNKLTAITIGLDTARATAGPFSAICLLRTDNSVKPEVSVLIRGSIIVADYSREKVSSASPLESQR